MIIKGFINVFDYQGKIILSAQPLKSRAAANLDMANYWDKDFRASRVAVVDLSKLPPDAIYPTSRAVSSNLRELLPHNGCISTIQRALRKIFYPFGIARDNNKARHDRSGNRSQGEQ